MYLCKWNKIKGKQGRYKKIYHKNQVSKKMKWYKKDLNERKNMHTILTEEDEEEELENIEAEIGSRLVGDELYNE